MLRERGIAWVKEQIEIEYQDILTNGGVPTPTTLPDGFGGFEFDPVGHSRNLPVLQNMKPEPGFDEWLKSNVEPQRDTRFAIATVKISQGNLTDVQMHALAEMSEQYADSLLRLTMTQNLIVANIPGES